MKSIVSFFRKYFLKSVKRKNKLNELERRCQERGEEVIKLLHRYSYSQFGEDRVLTAVLTYLFKRSIESLNYLDVGSSDPELENNTYFFYRKGGCGVLVEPNPIFLAKTELLRPRDIFLNCGVAIDKKKKADYYDFGKNYSGWNTFSKERAIKVLEENPQCKLERKIQLPLISINKILVTYFFKKELDFLSIDVEGLDLQILMQINFSKYRPKIICVESNKKDLTYGAKNEIINFMENKEYALVADTYINFIFADTKHMKPRFRGVMYKQNQLS